MMIVNLVDGEDFRQRLVALGVHVPEAACPETCARLAAGCYRAGRVPELPAAIREMTEQSDMLLPSVKAAIDQHLLPAFDGH
ncbi:hypothetical protein EVC62_00595 [Salinicola endophyticus]|uniref:Uncharacterized protein n=1 Tax=Salinicola endophyticus TaxID=1949083 RepID=A0ABY8FDI3_9GAMM|nr:MULTISPECIES: hypothetical protein [Salinicola]WFF40105.1 hypothetical protein EVC62_00595 [Salinicola endophyticus]